ncbi:hypothetical protein [Streptomyces sporangiiformans]|uniref:Uncharacterized protein n=1 Tax=Streptomyces sporangiiformans TaxID=2315329 RepID=A0A505DHT8_9ACTN|nr:hypothetical protein [Streptomyces sporangiiformans]TPQ21365.1 hypothetical protein FGD71_015580 [Streptomyces sporangiiformans]
MQQSAAAWLFEIALALRVNGPDAVPVCRRLLTAGVRIGITGLGGNRAPSGTDKPSRDAL